MALQHCAAATTPHGLPRLPPPLCSVVEEELRGIAREVKRQSAPRRPALPLPRAGSRPGLAARRQPSGALAAMRRAGSGGGAAQGGGSQGGAGLPPLPPQRQASGSFAAGQLLPQPSSSFLAEQPRLLRQGSGTRGGLQGPPGEAPPA